MSPRVYAVSGETDSSQTEFERLSNLLDVGVVGAPLYANALLFILRVLIDKNYDLLECNADLLEGNSEVPPDFDFDLKDYDSFKFALMQQELDHFQQDIDRDALIAQVSSSDGTTKTIRPSAKSKFYTVDELVELMSNL